MSTQLVPSPSLSAAATIALVPGARIWALDSSTVEQSYLAQLPNGRQFQIAELLYRTLEAIREPVALADLPRLVERTTGATLSAAQMGHLVEWMLLGSGLAVLRDGDSPSEPLPTLPAPRSALALHWSREVFAAESLAPLTGRLTGLFSRGMVTLLLTLTLGAHVVAYSRLGFPPRLDPSLVSLAGIVILFFTVGIIHELGHLAASSRYHCPHGPVGVGLYFLSPIWYSDVSASWRLPRRQRAVVDLGGPYFEILCTIPLALAYLAGAGETALWVLVGIDLTILMNLNPLLKFDGYWLLSDLTGVPNLHRRATERVAMVLRRAARALGLPVARSAVSPLARVTGAARYALPVYAAIASVCLGAILLLAVPLLSQVLLLYPVRLISLATAIGADLRHGAAGDAIAGIGRLVIPAVILLNVSILLARLTESAVRAVGRRMPSGMGRLALVGMVLIAIAATGYGLRRSFSVSEMAAGIAEGERAPDFSGTALGGQTIRLETLRGRRVFLKFWSPECTHCIAEIGALRRLRASMGGEVAFVTVAVNATPEHLRAFVREHGIDYPVVPDPDGRIARSYGLQVTPVAFYINGDGVVTRRLLGPQMPDAGRGACGLDAGKCIAK